MATNPATASIPLRTVARPGASQPAGTSAQSTTQPQNQTAVSPPSSGTPQRQPATSPSNATQRPNTSHGSFPIAPARTSNVSPLVEFLCKTWLGNSIAFIGFVLTVIALGWTLYSDIVQLRIEQWTAQTTALQACLSLENKRLSSDFCNKTIEAGISHPPIFKRALGAAAKSFNINDASYFLAAEVFWTVAAGVLTLVYFRPKMFMFPPIISMARAEYCGVGEASVINCGSLSSLPYDAFASVDNLESNDLASCLWKSKEGNISQNPMVFPEQTLEGSRIGTFYESDEDDLQDQLPCRLKANQPPNQGAIDELISVLKAYNVREPQIRRFQLGTFNAMVSHFTPIAAEYFRLQLGHYDGVYNDQGVKAVLTDLSMEQFRDLSRDVTKLSKNGHFKLRCDEENDREEESEHETVQMETANEVSSNDGLTHDSHFRKSDLSCHQWPNQHNLYCVDGLQIRRLLRALVPELKCRLDEALARRGILMSLGEILEVHGLAIAPVRESWRRTVLTLQNLEVAIRVRGTRHVSGQDMLPRLGKIILHAKTIHAAGEFVLTQSGRKEMLGILDILQELPGSTENKDIRSIYDPELWEVLPILKVVELIAEAIMAKVEQSNETSNVSGLDVAEESDLFE